MGACGGDRGQTPPPSRSFQTENRDSPGGTGGMKGNRTADRRGLPSSSRPFPIQQKLSRTSCAPDRRPHRRRTAEPGLRSPRPSARCALARQRPDKGPPDRSTGPPHAASGRRCSGPRPPSSARTGTGRSSRPERARSAARSWIRSSPTDRQAPSISRNAPMRVLSCSASWSV